MAQRFQLRAQKTDNGVALADFGCLRAEFRRLSKDVEIVLRNGRVLRIAADADLELLSALIACVEAA